MDNNEQEIPKLIVKNQKQIGGYMITVILIMLLILCVVPHIIKIIKNERDGFRQSRFSSGRSDVAPGQLHGLEKMVVGRDDIRMQENMYPYDYNDWENDEIAAYELADAPLR